MAIILYELDVNDGHNVHFVTGGHQHMLHFQSIPSQSERDEAIALFEQRLINEIAEMSINENEEMLL